MIFDTRDNVSWWLRIIAVALSVAILVTGGLVIGWDAYFGRMTIGDGYVGTDGSEIGSTIIDEGNVDGNLNNNVTEEEIQISPEENENQISSETIQPSALSDLKSNIKNWMNNGDPVRDNEVINFLFIGMENNDDNGRPQSLSVNGRADAMCIISVNKRTKTITLASIMRDQYCFIVTGNKGRYTKFHHALSYGGPEKQIEMIERYYKIVIDNYVIVNFASLPKVIDALGGVDIEVTKGEAAEARRLNPSWKWKVTGSPQTFHVGGEDALLYMRLRKGDTGGDQGRVGRQQKVIKTLISEVKNYSTAQMISAVNAVIPYVRTGLTSTDILAYAVTALSEGWLNYDIKQITLPDNDCAKDFSNPADGGWYWKVDFPVAAQKLQMALYGQSNIKLDSNRKKWI